MNARESAIRRCRKQIGLSQQALADALGVTKATMSSWETGRYDPTPRHAIALTRVLKLLRFEDIYPMEGEGA